MIPDSHQGLAAEADAFDRHFQIASSDYLQTNRVLSKGMKQTQSWSAAEAELWSRIEAHNFEPDQPFNFVQRLGRDHGWTLKEARSAVEEYKRFCFLAVVSPTPVTPSEAVDEVWHQHLIYSRDYWDLWCGTVLQTTLHHDPTPGGPKAQRRYHRQYAETLALYERYFGQPDEAWWPGTRARFGPAPRYRIVDTQQRYMFPKLWPFLHRILERR